MQIHNTQIAQRAMTGVALVKNNVRTMIYDNRKSLDNNTIFIVVKVIAGFDSQ